MKTLRVLVLLVLIVVAAHSQEIPPPANGKAAVYFVRISSLGSLADFAYFDRDKYIGKFHGAKFMRYECDPGEHLLWSKAENRDFVEAELEADRIYFLEAVPQMGAMKAGVSLQLIDMKDEKLKAKVMKILAKEPVVFTDSLLAVKSPAMKDVIVKGLAKYEEEKADGKAMVKLPKHFYYDPKK